MNWKAVSDELRKSATDAQEAANRWAVEGDPANLERKALKVACLDTEASILRALARAIESGAR